MESRMVVFVVDLSTKDLIMSENEESLLQMINIAVLRILSTFKGGSTPTLWGWQLIDGDAPVAHTASHCRPVAKEITNVAAVDFDRALQQHAKDLIERSPHKHLKPSSRSKVISQALQHVLGDFRWDAHTESDFATGRAGEQPHAVFLITSCPNDQESLCKFIHGNDRRACDGVCGGAELSSALHLPVLYDQYSEKGIGLQWLDARQCMNTHMSRHCETASSSSASAMGAGAAGRSCDTGDDGEDDVAGLEVIDAMMKHMGGSVIPLEFVLLGVSSVSCQTLIRSALEPTIEPISVWRGMLSIPGAENQIALEIRPALRSSPRRPRVHSLGFPLSTAHTSSRYKKLVREKKAWPAPQRATPRESDYAVRAKSGGANASSSAGGGGAIGASSADFTARSVVSSNSRGDIGLTGTMQPRGFLARRDLTSVPLASRGLYWLSAFQGHVRDEPLATQHAKADLTSLLVSLHLNEQSLVVDVESSGDPLSTVSAILTPVTEDLASLQIIAQHNGYHPVTITPTFEEALPTPLSSLLGRPLVPVAATPLSNSTSDGSGATGGGASDANANCPFLEAARRPFQPHETEQWSLLTPALPLRALRELLSAPNKGDEADTRSASGRLTAKAAATTTELNTKRRMTRFYLKYLEKSSAEEEAGEKRKRSSSTSGKSAASATALAGVDAKPVIEEKDVAQSDIDEILAKVDMEFSDRIQGNVTLTSAKTFAEIAVPRATQRLEELGLATNVSAAKIAAHLRTLFKAPRDLLTRRDSSGVPLDAKAASLAAARKLREAQLQVLLRFETQRLVAESKGIDDGNGNISTKLTGKMLREMHGMLGPIAADQSLSQFMQMSLQPLYGACMQSTLDDIAEKFAINSPVLTQQQGGADDPSGNGPMSSRSMSTGSHGLTPKEHASSSDSRGGGGSASAAAMAKQASWLTAKLKRGAESASSSLADAAKKCAAPKPPAALRDPRWRQVRVNKEKAANKTRGQMALSRTSSNVGGGGKSAMSGGGAGGVGSNASRPPSGRSAVGAASATSRRQQSAIDQGRAASSTASAKEVGSSPMLGDGMSDSLGMMFAPPPVPIRTHVVGVGSSSLRRRQRELFGDLYDDSREASGNGTPCKDSNAVATLPTGPAWSRAIVDEFDFDATIGAGAGDGVGGGGAGGRRIEASPPRRRSSRIVPASPSSPGFGIKMSPARISMSSPATCDVVLETPAREMGAKRQRLAR